MTYAKDRETARFYEALGPDHKVNASRPELLEENEFVFRAWSELSPSRPVHMSGVGAIPIAEIESWCRMAGLKPGDSNGLAEEIRQLDMIFLDILDSKRKAEKGNKNARS